MSDNTLLIYGAYGYTGNLIVAQAVKQGLKPIVAGRNASKIIEIAQQYNLPYRVFGIDQAHKHLEHVNVVLNCAGPFLETALSMVSACLTNHVHYLDITGEIEVFKYCHSQHSKAQQAGIILMPGVGFDIVPTDCLAGMLHQKMPNATNLTLAFSFGTAMSAGTLKTSLEGFGRGVIIRENNQLKNVPNAYKYTKIPFLNGNQWAVTIPWGDVYTAGISTGIPNGMVYMAMPKALIMLAKLSNPIRTIFTNAKVLTKLYWLIERLYPKGPNATLRATESSWF
jgi:short subunit dehydrogenase-like uncharacterized protein